MNGRGPVVVGALLAVTAVAVVVLSLGASPPPPFDPSSTSPSGYAAVARLLSERGVDIEQRTAVSVAQQGYGPGDTIVVPTPDLASFDELDALRAAAEGGAVVVLGSPAPERSTPLGGDLGPLGSDPLAEAVPDDAVLAGQPASPSAPGVCDVAELERLGPIDTWFAAPIEVDGRRSCFGDGDTAHVVVEPVGSGRVVTLSGPELLANARLWPDKEGGGRPLDNGALAVALVGEDSPRVTFVRAEPSPEPAAAAGQPSNPLRLLPAGLQAGLVVALVAFVCDAWSRSRRFGRVVRERSQVRIAGSELVEAVGSLSRRRGADARAARVLRRDFARRVGAAAGLGPAPDHATLVDWVARQSRRPPADVERVLSSDVTGPDALVQLSRALDALEEEVSRVRQP